MVVAGEKNLRRARKFRRSEGQGGVGRKVFSPADKWDTPDLSQAYPEP